MKKVIPNLKAGQVVQARVVEPISNKEFIVDFAGDLIRIQNHTPKPMAKGDKVDLVVHRLHPLTFRLKAKSRSQGLDINI